MPTSSGPVADVAPLLRGWLHLVCAFLAVPAGSFVVARADSPGARTGAVLYAVGMLVMFSVSAAYHRGRWSPGVRRWLKRADHGAIFVMIAATYSPLCLVVLRDGIGPWLLAGVWAGAGMGIAASLSGWAEKRIVGLVAYSALGWVALLALPELLRRLDAAAVGLLVLGGAIYSLGSIGLGLRWPKPTARVFGYHEVWHVLVVLAVACHFTVVWSVVA